MKVIEIDVLDGKGKIQVAVSSEDATRLESFIKDATDVYENVVITEFTKLYNRVIDNDVINEI